MATLRLVIIGPGGVGKSAVCIRLVSNHFVDAYDPTIEDSYRKQITVDDSPLILDLLYAALDVVRTPSLSIEEYCVMRDQWFRTGEWFVFVSQVTYLSEDSYDREVETLVDQIRRVKEIHGPLPVTFLANKCDLPRKTSRERLMGFVTKHQMLGGYYEVSAKDGTNIFRAFMDTSRMALAYRNAAPLSTLKPAPTGITCLLPWNWNKKAKWNAQKKQLEFTAAMQAKAASSVHKEQQENIAKAKKGEADFYFPPPAISRNPVGFYSDLAQLRSDPEGLRMCDASLVGEDGGEPIPVHKIVVCTRCPVLRPQLLARDTPKVVKIDLISHSILCTLVHWLYTNQIIDTVKPSRDVLHAAQLLKLPNFERDLMLFMQVTAKPLTNSAQVQAEMKPALSKDLRNLLSDVVIVVEKQDFLLHRAILWARCQWFRALLGERWQKGAEQQQRITVGAMNADVFAVLVEFLYTECAQIPEELAMDVLIAADMLNLPRLVQLAEMALQPVIDAGNAVALYLAAEAHTAKQLLALCEYWMAREPEIAEKHEQWKQIPDEVKRRVHAEHDKLVEERAKRRKEREQLAKMPCVLAPIVEEDRP